MPSLQTLAVESFWVEKSKYDDAEKSYFEQLSKKLLHDNRTLLSEENKNLPNLTMQSSEQLCSEKTEEHCVVPTFKSKKKKKNSINSEKNPIEQLSSIKTSESDAIVGQQVQEIDEIKEKTKKKKKKNKNQNSTEAAVDKNASQQQQHVNLEKDKKQIKQNAKNKGSNQCTLVSEIAKARQHIKNSLEKMDEIPGSSSELQERLLLIEKENAALREVVESLKKCCSESSGKIKLLEQRLDGLQATSTKVVNKNVVQQQPQSQNDDDDGVDLFASDSEDDAEADKVREERLAAYAAKKSTKPALIAKSSLLLDVKPWDDETDLKAMETEIRKIKCDGLLWGASKFAPVAFGIQKICINCVVEDEKVSIDWLTEEIEKIEDFVQSVDVAAFNKI